MATGRTRPETAVKDVTACRWLRRAGEGTGAAGPGVS